MCRLRKRFAPALINLIHFIFMANGKKLFNKKLWQTAFLFLFSVQILFLGVKIVFAQCGPAVGIPCNPLEGTVGTLSEAIIIIIRYLLSIIGIISLIFMVISGIKYMTSTGSEEKIKSAKEALYSSALGLAIALAAYGILEVIVWILNK